MQTRLNTGQALNCAVEYLKTYNKKLETPIVRLMEGGENEVFEAAFEQGVLSTARPGDGTGTKFSVRYRSLCFAALPHSPAAAVHGSRRPTFPSSKATAFQWLRA
jgi:hypothetical protein